jgi:catechol-2,3-dioxygenase
MNATPLGFQRIKVIAWSVSDLNRASRFYGETLGLPPACEGTDKVGYLLGHTILMLKRIGMLVQPNCRIQE